MRKKTKGSGRILKSLGIVVKPKKIDGKAQRVIQWDDKLMESLKKRYIPQEDITVERPISNVTDVTNVTELEKVTEVTGVTAVTGAEDLPKCIFSDCERHTAVKTPLGAPVCLEHLKVNIERVFIESGKKDLSFDDSFIHIVTLEADKKLLSDGFWAEYTSGIRTLL